MLIVLPPSETKRAGGTGAALELATLSFPELTPTRRRTVAAVAKLGRTPRTAARVLELGPGQREEIERNALLRSAPTCPAVERYTGVLYDALDVHGLSTAARRRADGRVLVCSALFGLLRAPDLIPAYRLSAGTKLPVLGGLPKLWKPTLQPLAARLADEQLVVDLRSGAYRALAPFPGAVAVRVLNERSDGTRGVVSHFNKATKGLVARLLVQSPGDCAAAADVAALIAAGGFAVEEVDAANLDVVLAA